MSVIAIVVHEFVPHRGTHRSCKKRALESPNRRSVDGRAGLLPNRPLQKGTRLSGRVFHSAPTNTIGQLEIVIAQGRHGCFKEFDSRIPPPAPK
jgi:hypothetical protein